MVVVHQRKEEFNYKGMLHMTQFQIECIESTNKGPREQYGKFIIEPLKQGQGLTIGVRRKTLSKRMKNYLLLKTACFNIMHCQMFQYKA